MENTKISQLRLGVKNLINDIILKTINKPPEEIFDLAVKLEQSCFTKATTSSRCNRSTYVDIYNGLTKGLSNMYGDYLEDTLALQIFDGRVTIDQATNSAVYNSHLHIEPRQQGRALIYSTLIKDSRFNDNNKKCRNYTLRIERGCYNAAITQCYNSDESYSRQWNSTMFTAIYSTRIGTIVANLDPSGSVSQHVGAPLALNKLAEGIWLPDTIGAMSAADLCPQASKALRDNINMRINQKINEKTYSYFPCPRCNQTNHTYRQVQIGAGDEISTFMCTCKECGENYEGHSS